MRSVVALNVVAPYTDLHTGWVATRRTAAKAVEWPFEGQHLLDQMLQNVFVRYLQIFVIS
jgi:hypothetical protein